MDGQKEVGYRVISVEKELHEDKRMTGEWKNEIRRRGMDDGGAILVVLTTTTSADTKHFRKYITTEYLCALLHGF